MQTRKDARQVTARMVTAGIFAAVIFVATYLHIPLPANQGYVHTGDALLYLAACVLPMPYAMAAGAIGEAISDLISAPVYVPATLIIKCLLALFFTAKPEKFIVRHNIVGVFLAGLAGLLGYFIFESTVFHSVQAAALNMLFGSLQPIVSGIVFVLLGSAFARMHLKQRLSRR